MADDIKNIKIDVDFGKIDQAKQDIFTMSGDAKKLNDAAREYNNLVDDLNTKLKLSVNALKDLKNDGDLWLKKSLEQASAQEELNKGIKNYSNAIKNISSNQTEISKAIAEGVKARRKLGEYESKSIAAQEELNKAIQQGITDQAILGPLKQDVIDASKSLVLQEEKASKLAKIINGEYEIKGKKLNAEDTLQAKIAATQALQNEQQKDIVINRKRELDILSKQTDKIEKLKAGYKYITEQFGKTDVGSWVNKQTAAIGITFQAIINNFLKFDALITDNAKQLGISTQGGRALAQQFDSVAFNAQSINKNATTLTANIKAQFEAQQQLNEALGTSVLFSDKERVDQTVITKQMGLQAQEGANIYKLGKLTGQTAEDIYTTTANQVIAARSSLKVQLDFKTVLKDVANTSAQIAAQYKNNPEAIAKAVVQVRALGLTMEQAANASEKLLDFSTSIENELKAELLVGKAINLEQARYYALMGDTAGAAKELMANIGGMSEYQNLNVIQQKALAESVGMTREELAKTLQTQELLKNTSFQTEEAFKAAAEQAAREGKSQEFINSLRQAGNSEELIAQATQISNQEKFQLAIEKLQETLVTIVNGPMGILIDKFANFVSKAENLKSIFRAISLIIGVQIGSSIAGIVSGFPKMLQGAKAFGKAMKEGAKAAALTSAFSSGIAGALIGLAAAGAAIAIVNSALPDIDDGGGGVSAGGTGGVNIPTRSGGGGMGPTQPIQITNVNTTYVGPNKMSQFSDTQQIGQNTRYS